jgi:hypothetical protein
LLISSLISIEYFAAKLSCIIVIIYHSFVVSLNIRIYSFHLCIRHGKIPIGISINSSLSNQQLDTLYQTIFPTDLPFAEDKIIDERDFATANGYKGFKFVIVQNETNEEEPGVVSKATQFWLPSNEDVFMLEYVGDLSTYDRYLPVAEKMVDSFKFLKDKGYAASSNLTVRQMLMDKPDGFLFYKN